MTDHDENLRAIWSDAELDAALDGLHADVPTDERALSEARAVLLAAALAPGEGNPMSTTTERHEVRPAPSPPSIRRRLAAAAAVAAIAAGGAVLAVSLNGDDGRSGPPRAGEPTTLGASELLVRAAANVAPDERVGPGQYLYIRSTSWSSASVASGPPLLWLQESKTETWVPADRTDEWMQRRNMTGKRKWLIGSEQEAKKSGATFDDGLDGTRKGECGDFYADEDGGGTQDPCAGSWLQPMPEWIAGLPTDPRAMLERLRKDLATDKPGSRPVDDRAFEEATHALASGLLPSRVRATLYKAFALMPDITITDDEVTLDGRHGTALGMPYGEGEAAQIIIDEQTGEFIGHRRVRTDRGMLEEGTVIGNSAYVTAVVDKMGQRPPK